MKMRAISIRQPWALHVIRPDITDPAERAHAISERIVKDIENRVWKTKYRGPVLIHAAKGMRTQELWDANEFASGILKKKTTRAGIGADNFCVPVCRGGIIGYAEITSVVTDSPSPWFVGPYGLTLANPVALPFLPCRGALQIFSVDVPDHYCAAIPGFKAPL